MEGDAQGFPDVAAAMISRGPSFLITGRASLLRAGSFSRHDYLVFDDCFVAAVFYIKREISSINVSIHVSF